MSNYKLTFKLKQHTPLIHFQHDQAGATLRATELKPKLDRFLIEKLGLTEIKTIDGKEKEVPKEEYKNWFINEGKQHLALDYKVRVEKINTNVKSGEVILIPPVKDKWILSDGVSVTITSFNNNLLEKFIKDNAPSQLLVDFFNVTNFGKRTSKGFGAFYIEKSLQKFEESLKRLYPQKVYKYKILLYRPMYNDNNPTVFYKEISRNWSLLKSGKNHNGYVKSKVFDYLATKQLRWGKRWIKRKMKELIDNGTLPKKLKYKTKPIDINDTNTWDDVTYEEYRYGRALLGLAEHYEYQTVDDNYKYQVIVDGGNIERFKSPITFKVFDKTIYALIEEFPKEILNAPFSFSVQKKRKVGRDFVKDGNLITITGVIKTPINQNEFKLTEFASSFLTEVNFIKL